MSEQTESTATTTISSSNNNSKQILEQNESKLSKKDLLKNNFIKSSSSSSSSTETTTIENELLTIIDDNNLINNNNNNNNNCDINNKQEIDDIDEIILKIEEINDDNNEDNIIIDNNYIKCNGKLINNNNNDQISSSPTKSILTNGNGPKRQIKKSVSFDPPNDETFKKFIEGDVIVDKKNPFKNGNILIIDNSNKNNDNKKLIFHKLRKDNNKQHRNLLIENDFVTTEDVLKESKYVKTYIKNPDKYFTYDPTVLAKIKFDELKELKDKKLPKEKKSLSSSTTSTRLTQQTQQRLKDLKNKYSPSPIYGNTKVIKTSSLTSLPISSSTKIPTFKKVSKANYPDLSDIKVKCGTDLEKSLFNPDEVTKNAKKFDERVKSLHITSDDDLEEIDEQLTKSDSSDDIKILDQIDSNDSFFNISNSDNNKDNNLNNSEESGSFTNTVNSKEFQEYLDKKGLTLTPQHNNNNTKQLNGNPFHLKIGNNKSSILENNIRTINNKMEPKKIKKQSVFQRLLPSNIFSSKRKTTPKETVPIPQSLYPKENGYKTSSNIKRVILERQSFHGSSGNSLNSSNDFKKHIERSRKSYAAGDDRSSSISSALTNAEEFPDTQSTDSILNGCKDERTIVKSSSQVRSRSTSRERLQNLHGKTLNESGSGGSGNLIRPKIQRASLPISALRPLPNKTIERNEKQQGNGPMRRSLERQNMVTKRPSTVLSDDGQQQLQYGRSASMDRHENTKRPSNRLSSSLPKPSRNSVASQRSSIHTPKNSREDLLDASGPKITSTPNSDINGIQMKSIQKPLAPISVHTAINGLNTPANYNVGIEEWTKLKEIKEKTDRELFNRIIHTNQKNSPNLPNGHIRQYENIYEKLPIQQQQQQPQSLPNQYQQQAQPQLRHTMSPIMSSPLYAQLIPEDGGFIRGSPQRNTFNGVIRSNHRNAKIIDGTPINIPENQIIPIEPSVKIQNNITQPPRSQSVLDEMMGPNNNSQLHQQTLHNQDQVLYGSVSGTPVIMRRKELAPSSNGSLTREEILQKVKDFCRKSMNKTPTKLSTSSNSPSGQNHIQNDKLSSDISPVSYASVEYHNNNNRGRITPQKPQVPQRVQSLSSAASPQTPNSTSPIYAHVIKRNSVQSNVSDILDSPNRRISSAGSNYNQQQFLNRPQLSTQISDTDSVFLPNGYLSPNQHPQSRQQQQQLMNQQPQRPASATQFLVMDSEKVTPSHVMKFNNAQNGIGNGLKNNSYGQLMPSPYGYIQLTPQQQQLHRSRMDGRSTPLILERGVGGPQGSQIYWSPVQQHSPRPLHHSPVTKYSQQFPQQQQQQINQQHQQQQQQQQSPQTGNVVFLKVKDQIYRPIKYPREPQQQQQQRQQQQIISHPQQQHHQHQTRSRPHAYIYESESGSEAGEVQRIMQNRRYEEDWQNDKSGRNQSSEQASDDRRRGGRREDPRRHTLGGDMLQYGSGQGQPQQRAMDLEMGTRAQKSKKGQPVRGYTPINQGPLFDEDPGIMSEVETASTGFRRGGKQRSSLPVVRTPSKTLERPLGLVFLQYRSETKRALLPNEITSIDTVRALFVRSFPRQLSMAYLEGPNVKIYIHDASKDMFYELEDVRSHLREIRDRSVLRLFESNEVAAPQVLPGGPGVPQPLPQSTSGHWDQDQSYFSEPEFDSEYQHQHIHKSKGGKTAPYYVGTSQTLPRGMYSDRNKNAVGAPAKPLRSYGSRGSMGPPYPSYPQDQLYSIPDGYTSSPERGTRGGYEEPYYSQYGTRGTPVVPMVGDEQRCDGTMTEDEYALYGMKVSGRIPRNANQLYDPTRPEDLHRIRVEHMERQLANLTGLVQKALVNQNPQIVTHVPQSGVMNPNYLGVPGQCRGLDDMDGHSSGSSTSIQANGTGDDLLYIREKPPKLGKSLSHKSVSFEKSVSFSDDIQGVPKSHSPQHAADSKPPKPAIKSSTLPRTSSQERDRLKPPPPPKPLALAQTHPNYRPDIALAPEVYNHLRGLQKKAKDLRMEVRTLRRLSQAQAVAVREDIKDAFMRIRATLLAGSGSYWGQGDQEKTRFSREEELYKQEVIRLENDLSDLESSVEGLRGEVINRRTRVNMAAVEDMALVLSRASKTVAELKMRFPGLQNGLRNILSNEMEKVVREEKFLKEEPDRLESALRRCKKLTGTLVTLKRLASVQEQRVPVNEPITEDPPRSAEISSTNKPIPSPRLGSIIVSGGIPPENALDALLDELQTFAKPQINNDGRPDDSTSDDSSQTLHNTITTQLSQSSLYIDPSNPNNPQNPNNGGIIGIGMMNNINHNNNNNNNIINNNQLTTSNLNSLRRLHSYPSGSDTDTSPPQQLRPGGKPPIPERNAELLSKVGNKRIPPPPPPRTSSRSPLASPTSPNISSRLPSLNEICIDNTINNGGSNSSSGGGNLSGQDGGDSSGNESGNDHVQRQLALEVRHQELLKKQKLLQEQYARLQQMSKNPASGISSTDILQLKKTGSESNLPQKMSLNMTVTGSMKNLNADTNVNEKNEKNLMNSNTVVGSGGGGGIGGNIVDNGGISITDKNKIINNSGGNSGQTTTNKVYETDIL